MESDVLGGVARAHQQQRLALELARVTEVVSVEDSAGEPGDNISLIAWIKELPALPLYPREGWHVGNGVVTGGDNDVVEILALENLVLLQVLGDHGEVVPVLVVSDILDNRAR